MLKEKVSWSIIKFSWEFLKGNINVSFSFSFNSLPSFLSFLLMLQAIALSLKAVSWSPKEFEERERERVREQTKFLTNFLRTFLNTCLTICVGFQLTQFQMLQTERSLQILLLLLRDVFRLIEFRNLQLCRNIMV